MAVFVPGTNVAMVEIRGDYFGQQVENTLYFQNVGAINALDANDLMDYMENVLCPGIAGAQSNAYTWRDVYVTDLTTNISPTYSKTFSPVIPGVSANPGMPGSVALCLSFRTAGRGRSSRGRNYISGLTEADVTANVVSNGLILGLTATYADMLSGGGLPTGWTWVVFSRYTNGAPRGLGLAKPVTNVISTDPTVDSQRGRLR